jgi:transcriptional regulator with XRE-family HTH domain
MTLKRLRQKKGLTQATLATRAKLHRVYVAQIEAQTKIPSLAALERLARVLGVPVTELLR